VRTYLVSKGQLAENRVVLAAAAPAAEAETVKAPASRVDFSLQ
jgi:hypothetical protein